MSRLVGYVVGLGTLGAVLAPGFAAPGWDSYPLSSYPMFTQNREKPLLHFVELVDAAGRRERVPPQYVANDEVMQAVVTVRRAVEGGPAALDVLCREVARRVVEARGVARERNTVEARGVAREREPRALEIVGARFDPIRYFVQGPAPEERATYCRCALRSAP